MIGKKLLRIIAVCTACLGIFAFTGCNKKAADDNGGNNVDTEFGGGGGSGGSGTGGDNQSSGGSGTGGDNQSSGGSGTGGDNQNPGGSGTGGDNQNPGGGTGGEPEITGPVKGSPVNLKASDEELETAYVTWEAADNAKWYNVYYSVANANQWTRIDAPLVREYKDYFRADVLGLKEGDYDVKVVPVSGEGEEATEFAESAKGITVNAHDRTGYAFVNGSSSGAYNMDGTLKAGANVVYVTDANKDSVSLEMSGATVTGIQNILDAQAKSGKPLAIRLIGSISAPDVSTSKQNSNINTLLIKGGDKLPDLATTLEGVGNDATANGWTLRLTRAKDVEVRNIGFMNTHAKEPDGITLEKDEHIWIHNCDIFYGGAGGDSDQAKGDGALDTKESSYITHSYNHFWDTGKSNLQGMDSEKTTNYITYHHNWYDHSDSRHPRIRTCTVHVYNNYFDGNAKYGVGVTMGTSTFVEGNYFRSTTDMRPMLNAEQGTDALGEGTFSGDPGGMIKSFNNKYDCPSSKLHLITQNDTADKSGIDCYEASSRNEQVSSDYKAKSGGTVYSNFDTDSSMHTYSVDTPDEARAKVERYAGRMDGGDFKWEFDNDTEDGNYSIIKALKTALTEYKSSLIKVDGVVVGSGSTGGTTGGGGNESGNDGPIDLTGLDVILFCNGVKNVEGQTISGVTIANEAYKSGGSFTFNGTTYDSPLKLQTGTSVKMTFDKAVTLKIYLSESGKKLKVNGTGYTSDSNKCVEVPLSAGECLIEKGDSTELCYILISSGS